jgi:hypothetical protein
MKVAKAVELAARWSGGDKDRGVEIFLTQATLDPELREQFEEEAQEHYVIELISGLLESGYSLERPEELIAAVVSRLQAGPCA